MSAVSGLKRPVPVSLRTGLGRNKASEAIVPDERGIEDSTSKKTRKT
ncbi:MAG: hypothetical protein JJE18_11440 [Eubacteriaceae bacterium]|nr:hypothetical protein [Eubacteriaceae bacterium]